MKSYKTIDSQQVGNVVVYVYRLASYPSMEPTPGETVEIDGVPRVVSGFQKMRGTISPQPGQAPTHGWIAVDTSPLGWIPQ